MKPSPAFQFYPSDFLVGTAEMTAEEAGAYVRLLCFQWTNNGVPDDNRKLAAMAGVDVDVIESIRSKFGMVRDGRIFNIRLESVRNQQEEYRLKQSDNARRRWDANALPPQCHGIANGDAKKDAVALPTVMPNTMPNGCTSSSTLTLSSTIPSPSEKRDALPWSDFMERWNELPKEYQKIRAMSDARKESLRARLRDKFWVENWKTAIQAIPSIPWMSGRTERKWYATPEYFLRPDTVLKIIEGQHNVPAPKPPPPPKDTRPWEERALDELFKNEGKE